MKQEQFDRWFELTHKKGWVGLTNVEELELSCLGKQITASHMGHHTKLCKLYGLVIGRRGVLIHKRNRDGLSEEESQELERLEFVTDAVMDRFPTPNLPDLGRIGRGWSDKMEDFNTAMQEAVNMAHGYTKVVEAIPPREKVLEVINEATNAAILLRRLLRVAELKETLAKEAESVKLKAQSNAPPAAF